MSLSMGLTLPSTEELLRQYDRALSNPPRSVVVTPLHRRQD